MGATSNELQIQNRVKSQGASRTITKRLTHKNTLITLTVFIDYENIRRSVLVQRVGSIMNKRERKKCWEKKQKKKTFSSCRQRRLRNTD